MVMRSPTGGLQSDRVRAALYYAKKKRIARINAVNNLYTQMNAFAEMTNLAGWGTILRNPAYAGPCIQVLNTDDGTTTANVGFKSSGVLDVSAIPFTNYRVEKIYDQWDDDDLLRDAGTCTVVDADADTKVPRFVFNGTGGFYTTKNSLTGAAWAVAKPIFGAGIERDGATGLKSALGVNHSFYMTWGLWNSSGFLNWRWNGNNATNWSSSNVNIADFHTAIGVGRQAGLGSKAYYDGTLNHTHADTNEVTFPVAPSFRFGFGDKEGTVGDPFIGKLTEVHIFSNDTTDEPSSILDLDTALVEPLTIGG